jgi:hypothetical protein
MQTYYDNYLNMAKTYLKVLKDNYSMLRKSLLLEAFACLEVWLFGYDESVLLSVVAQVLLLTIVCRFLSLSSGDAVDDSQWEVQASKC